MVTQIKPTTAIVQPAEDYLADEVTRQIGSFWRVMHRLRRGGPSDADAARRARWALVNLLEIRRNARQRTLARQRREAAG